MKKILFLMMICGSAGSHAQTVPPFAASSRTWVIEGSGIAQTWSDHINAPACNKADFDGGSADEPKADCRNNPGYYYLYSWRYVHENAAALCPSPWRVPSRDDFEKLGTALGKDNAWREDGTRNLKYAGIWGGVYGGIAFDTFVRHSGSLACYWSSSLFDTAAHYLSFHSERIYPPYHFHRHFGFQVRCVL
ncbi:MAG: fibrobacter succinogenes major paralogous domain-containing protein [Prevotellaceae bacterium]|nr:fibrobacter succinogenes major paralogous domain-containing protein [Prevotellaceae bacterium]